MNIEGLLNDDTLPAVPENLPKWDGTSIAAPQVGVFDGTWDAMKDILPNAALTTGSAATSVISQASSSSPLLLSAIHGAALPACLHCRDG